MAYSDKVLDHYDNPRNVGKLDDKSSMLVPVWLEHQHVVM